MPIAICGNLQDLEDVESLLLQIFEVAESKGLLTSDIETVFLKVLNIPEVKFGFCEDCGAVSDLKQQLRDCIREGFA